MAGRRVFISYTEKDSEVARMIDASLRVASVETFLDQREIRVGDSIIKKVYEGIASATDLIYIVSKNSVRSKWVAEELNAAKVRHREEEGFRILPVLIDPVKPPTEILDLRYIDLCEWRDPAAYRRELLHLLRALEVEPLLTNHREISWWMASRAEIAQFRSGILECYNVLDTVMGYVQYFNYSPPYEQTYYFLHKIVFREYGLTGGCVAILILMQPLTGDRRVEVITESCQIVQRVGYLSRNEVTEADLRELIHALSAILTSLRDLESEVMTAISGAIDTGTEAGFTTISSGDGPNGRVRLTAQLISDVLRNFTNNQNSDGSGR